jgi:hypothetical protein
VSEERRESNYEEGRTGTGRNWLTCRVPRPESAVVERSFRSATFVRFVFCFSRHRTHKVLSISLRAEQMKVCSEVIISKQ